MSAQGYYNNGPAPQYPQQSYGPPQGQMNYGPPQGYQQVTTFFQQINDMCLTFI
jgi:hypothetical protein